MFDTLYQIIEASLPSSGYDTRLCIAIALIPSPHGLSKSPSSRCSTKNVCRLKWTSNSHVQHEFLPLAQEYEIINGLSAIVTVFSEPLTKESS